MHEPNLSALSLIAEALRLTKKSFLHWYVSTVVIACLGFVALTTFPQLETLATIGILTAFLVALRNADGGWPELPFFGCLLRAIGATFALALFLSPFWLLVLLPSGLSDVQFMYARIAAGVLTIYAMMRFMLAPAVCCCEEVGPLEALQRAKKLMGGRFFSLVFAYLAAILVAALVISTLVMAAAFVLSPLSGGLAIWLLVPVQFGFGCCLPLSVQMVAYMRLRSWELGLQ